MDEIVLNSGSKAERIVFLFHGYGADNENMRSVGEVFLRAFPETEIHIPNGIEEVNGGSGRQWFFLEGNDVEVWKHSCNEKSEVITDYVFGVLADKGLTCKDAVFAGFSQGAMLSLNMGFKLDAAGIISFSGMLLGSDKIIFEKLQTKVFLAHGRQDSVVPFECFKETEKFLKEVGVCVESAVSPSADHMIDNYLLTRALDFLKGL
jgi:phospholipase/carboxylesterase